MIHRSLPDSYIGLVTALESCPDEDLTIDFVNRKLWDLFQRRSERFGGWEEKIMKAKDKKSKVCFHCQKPGHFKVNCHLMKQQQQQQNEKSEDDSKNSKHDSKQIAKKDLPVCFKVDDNLKNGSWYIDSGCSCHMTSERTFFVVSDTVCVVALGEVSGDLYALRMAEHAKLGRVMHHLKDCQHTWHRPMGHQDPAVRERAKELSEVSVHRLNHVLDLIHSDVCGPVANVTSGGCRYILTLTDDYSSYCVVFLL
ncbi:uncharacterized protein LOC129778296 [Toxorhynchites rutilus septentrionalis]|uniref:uncharacterized protein LOC129778296 n=1 Tax=Toxorhynchites rutilus septentrionalis TaxID=329112 RepID=UPI00247A8516|nr:uncharacterized protein LOC129778296 [Toxorhynchites rutilus septentrionalis]